MNIRTSGTLSREDLQRLSVTQTHEGEGNPQSQLEGQTFDLGGFDDLGQADPRLAVEGDSTLQVP